MCLNKNTFFKILFLFFVLVMIASCAPKKVRLYDVSDIIRTNVVASSLSLQGKPYKSGARGPDAFDCSGLVYYVFRQHRVLLLPPAEAQGRAGREVDREGVQPGDLVLFKIRGDFHIGIMINGVEFIHASSSKGVAIDNISMGYWQKQFVGYRSVL